MPSTPTAERAACAACGATIDTVETKCPQCGNAPRTKAIIAALGTAAFAAVLYAIIPTLGLMFLPLALLVGVATLLLDHSPTESASLF